VLLPNKNELTALIAGIFDRLTDGSLVGIIGYRDLQLVAQPMNVFTISSPLQDLLATD